MSAMNDFADLVRSLSPAMATLLLRGHPETLDSYSRTRVVTAGTAGIGLTWRRDKKGYYLGQQASLTAGGGAVSIVDSGAAPETRATSGTIFFTAKSFQTNAKDYTGGNARVFAKADVGGIHCQLLIAAANTLALYDGTTSAWMASTALSGARTAAIRFVSGTNPQLFVDGVYRVTSAATVTPTGNDADLYMANSVGLNAGSRRNDYGLFAMFNDAILGRAISDQEIAELHDAWERVGSVFMPRRTIYLPRKATEIVATAPLVHLAGARTGSGLLLDQSGNGRNGAISGRVTQKAGPDGVCQVAHGAGDPLIITASDASLNPTNITASIRLVNRALGQSNVGCILALNNNLTYAAELINAGAGGMYWVDTYSDGVALWRFPVPAVSSREVSIVVKHNRADPTVAPTVFVDGEQQTITVIAAKTGTLVANAAPRVSLLNRGAADLDWDGCVKDAKVYASLLTDAECRALYLDHALSGARRLANRTDDPVSVAAVSAGGKCGPWRVLSGTHKWDDDGTRRRMLGVTAGYCTSRDSSPQAYGAWYFRACKGSAAFAYFPLMASKSIASAAFDGYALGVLLNGTVFIIEFPAGSTVAASSAGAVAVGTEYEFFVTRRPRDGFFTVWIRGGAYATWTSLLTGTDNTHTQSAALVGCVDAGGYVADMQLFPNGGGLVPNDVPWLKDAA